MLLTWLMLLPLLGAFLILLVVKGDSERAANEARGPNQRYNREQPQCAGTRECDAHLTP